MSVINQMLRELDARGGTSAELPVTPIHPVGAKRRPPWLVFSGMGLLAAAAAAASHWMLHTAPAGDAPQDVPVIARQEARAVNTPSDAAGRRMQPAPMPVLAAAEPAIVISRQPQTREPSRARAQAATRQPSSATSEPAPLAQDQATPQLEPAVVRTVTAPSPEAEAQQLYDEAQLLRGTGKADAAIVKYRQALERNPGMTGARLQLARLLQEKGRADAALEQLKAGFEQRADDALAIAAGRLLADLGQREAALEWLQRGQADLRPADHALMGALLSQAHRHEAASRAYQRALAADPGQGGWLLGLGLALEAQGRLDEARTAYRTALERGQFKPEVMQFLRERSGLSGP